MGSPPTGMVIDGVFASEAIDSSGEIVSIKGMDISTFENGQGVANYEHLGEDDGGMGREVVGRVIRVCKVFSDADCEGDERILEYRRKLKGIPFLYGQVRLSDGAGHSGAKDLAASMRDHAANGEDILVRYSIEGSTLKKEGNFISRSIAKKVAMTWKPCNKTSFSGIVFDPNAPDGWGQISKTEIPEDPSIRKLGGVSVVACNPIVGESKRPDNVLAQKVIALAAGRSLLKAMSAGSMDAAPSSLTGGAALQKESIGHIKNQALAAIRDYKERPFKKTRFRAFAKARLPEVSDEFLDHFEQLAEDYHIRKSTEIMFKAAQESPEPLQKKAVENLAKPGEATFRGEPVRPNPDMKPQEASVDVNKGVLHTNIGSFNLYHPRHDGAEDTWNEILNHPDISETHDKAMENWTQAHRLFKQGKVPHEVAMHAAIFSQLSPQTQVPNQELMFGHMHDVIQETGTDPRDPRFGDLKENWMSRDRPTGYPNLSRQFFQDNPGIHYGKQIGGPRYSGEQKEGIPSGKGRFPGEIHLFDKPNQKWKRVSEYHKVHHNLMDAISKHPGDARAVVTELMGHKIKQKLHTDRRKRQIKAGKSDPGEYPYPVTGLSVKTSRYMTGLLGGGNVVVPDTHFIRSLVGLDRKKDGATINTLRGVLWNERNAHVVDAVDRWYAQNHPTVKHMTEHPRWGQYFEKPEDALFPSFWKHWLATLPYEKKIGLKSGGQIERTTHKPYWDAIRPHIEGLGKTEDFSPHTVPFRTAQLHAQYAKDYGEVPASMMYYAYIYPKLMEAARHRERFQKGLDFLAKTRQLESELVDLRKNLSELAGDIDMPEVHRVTLKAGDKQHSAGRFLVHRGRLHHLEDYHGVLDNFLPEGHINKTILSRLHGLKFSPHISMEPHKVDSQKMESGISVEPVEMPKRHPVFHYHRPGMTKPHTIEFGPRGAAMDGIALDNEELALILDNARNGRAELRYKPSDKLKKTEKLDPGDALEHVRQAVSAGHVHPDVERALTQHIYEDPMNEGVGNKYAYNRFREKDRTGVFVSMDANDFKSLNDTHGHDAGDEAIKGMGSALRSAADKVGTGKLFRPGGDEYVAHFPSHEDALRFARHARSHLDDLAPVGGTHKISMSFGFGTDFGTADQALMHAKKGKMDSSTGQRAFRPGETPHLAHSAVPGNEGPVKLHDHDHVHDLTYSA